MINKCSDIWAQWLLQRRHGGNRARLQETLARLYPVRDKVLEHVDVTQREVLLDVGCGDGLIAFGALEKNPRIRVILSDISRDLLDHARISRSRWQWPIAASSCGASADDLAPLDD